MKIAVISDTHMPKRAKQLPTSLVEGIRGVDTIVHAGDWTSMDVLYQLEEIAPVEGVSGNVDSQEVREYFGETKILTFHGFTIGVVHGHFGKKKTTPERAREAFQNQALDLIIFGHSHIPYLKRHGDTILFNPGSPTDKRFQKNFSYGMIELGKSIVVKHFFYTEKT